jgi:hypothetical protein
MHSLTHRTSVNYIQTLYFVSINVFLVGVRVHVGGHLHNRYSLKTRYIILFTELRCVIYFLVSAMSVNGLYMVILFCMITL